MGKEGIIIIEFASPSLSAIHFLAPINVEYNLLLPTQCLFIVD